MNSIIFTALVAIALLGLLHVALLAVVPGDVRMARIARDRRDAGIDRTRESEIIAELKRLGAVATPVESPSFLLKGFVEDLSILAVALKHGLVSVATALAKAARLVARVALESLIETGSIIADAAAQALEAVKPVASFAKATLVTLIRAAIEVVAAIMAALAELAMLALWVAVALTRKAGLQVRTLAISVFAYGQYRIAKAQAEAQVRAATRNLEAALARAKRTEMKLVRANNRMADVIRIAELRAELEVVQAGIQSAMDATQRDYRAAVNAATAQAYGMELYSVPDRKNEEVTDEPTREIEEAPKSQKARKVKKGSNRTQASEVASQASQRAQVTQTQEAMRDDRP